MIMALMRYVLAGRRGLAGVLVTTLGVALACGGSSGPNRRSQCTQVLEAACGRLGGTCMLFPSNQISGCVQAGINSCCAGNCGASVVSTEADIDACVTEIKAATCASLDVTNGGTLPPSCVGVVRSALSAKTSALQSTAASPGERIGNIVAQ